MRVPPKPVSTDTIPPALVVFAALMVSRRFRGRAASRAESLGFPSVRWIKIAAPPGSTAHQSLLRSLVYGFFLLFSN